MTVVQSENMNHVKCVSFDETGTPVFANCFMKRASWIIPNTKGSPQKTDSSCPEGNIYQREVNALILKLYSRKLTSP